jgi:nucleotide-binding universal stress UspA family protein
MTEQPTPQAPRRILVPLDGSFFSEQVLSHAQAVGGRDAELVLLTVVPPAEPVRGLLGKTLVSAEDVRRAYTEGTRKDLERAERAWLGDRPNVVLEVVVGDPAAEILRAAEVRGTDLIVMATHGRGALNRWAVGSVADRVARTSSIPVMLVRPWEEMPTEPGAWAVERLVVPLDGSSVAAQAVPFAGALAAHLSIPILLATVTDIAPELSGFLVYAAAFSQQVYDELLAVSRAKAHEMLADAANTLRRLGVSVSEQVLEGPVAESIAGVAGPRDVIVMTSHGRSGVRRWVLGSVALKLIQHGEHPVVLVPSTPRRDEAAGERSEK